MTVEIAVVCNNRENVIVASDKMVSYGFNDIEMEFECSLSKTIKLTETCALATAGNALLTADYVEMLQETLGGRKKVPISEISEKAREHYVSMRQVRLEQEILLPKGIKNLSTFHKIQDKLNPEMVASIHERIDDFELEYDILIAGVDKKGGHLYGIDNPGVVSRFDDIGFNAIGNGGFHSIASLVSTGFRSSMSLSESLLHVYEAKKIAERAPGVGPGTEMVIINADGMKFLDNDQLVTLESVWQSKVEKLKAWQAEMNWVGKMKEIVDKWDLK
jgi:hypothetical protein